MTRSKIIFLCTGNSARSQMAEAFLHTYADDYFEAYSAGLEPKGLNPLTVAVMDEVGIDVSMQESKGVGVYLGKVLFQYLITVCDNADKNCPTIWPGVNIRMHWSFPDPAAFDGTEEEKLARFREVRNMIDEKIKNWLAEQGIAIIQTSGAR